MTSATVNWSPVLARMHPLNYSLIYFRVESELKREAESHILNHVNIVKLYAMVFEPNHYGVVLEYVPHGDLSEFIFQYKVRLFCVYEDTCKRN